MTAQQRQGQAPPATAGQELEVAQKSQATQLRELVMTYRSQFTAVVPKHIDPAAFIELAIATVKRSKGLLEATKVNSGSLIMALRECASKGHMPVKGIFSLVPMTDNTQPGGKAVVGMEEWRGVVERMFRAGGCQSVHVEVGRDNDKVLRFNRTTMVLPDHDYDEFAGIAERGPIKATYAWARLIGGGTSQVAWLNRHELLRHRAMSRSVTDKNNGGNFWGPLDKEGPNFEPMCKKTALHVLEGFVPTSSAYRWEVAQTEAAARDWSGVPDRAVTSAYSDDPPIFDAELVD